MKNLNKSIFKLLCSLFLVLFWNATSHAQAPVNVNTPYCDNSGIYEFAGIVNGKNSYVFEDEFGDGGGTIYFDGNWKLVLGGIGNAVAASSPFVSDNNLPPCNGWTLNECGGGIGVSGGCEYVPPAPTCFSTISYNTPGVHTYTLPAGADYLIKVTATGAPGGHGYITGFGYGATIEGTFEIPGGTTLYAIVGEQGKGIGNSLPDVSGGGGGGTGVTDGIDVLLVGGGGAGGGLQVVGGHGQTYSDCTSQTCDGLGGNGNYLVGGGGGFFSAGTPIPEGGGQAVLTAIAAGGVNSSVLNLGSGGAGFGGGGAGAQWPIGSFPLWGGGGGGYKGGAESQGGFSFINLGIYNASLLQDVPGSANGPLAAVQIECVNIITDCNNPDVPQLAASPTTVCPGETVNITLTGDLNDATEWVVYSGSCGGTQILTTTASNFTVTPNGTTEYFVRGEGDCVTPGDCASITITADDTEAPVITCQDVTAIPYEGSWEVDAGTVDYLVTSSSDNCGTVNFVSASQTVFTCADLGPQPLTLNFEDDNGNAGSCTLTVTVVDNVPPSRGIRSGQTFELDANGELHLTPANFLSYIEDNCTEVDTSLSQTLFTCADLGEATVDLFYSDQNGNSDVAEDLGFTIVDNLAPQVVCQDITVQLDADGEFDITADDIIVSSSDNCGSVSVVDFSDSHFDCFEIGTKTVSITISDGSGNEASCSVTVTIEDALAPVPQIASLADVVGECVATVANAPLADDNCGSTIAGTTTDPTVYTEQGTYTITWTYTDDFGNTSSQNQTVVVDDTTVPNAVCQNITVGFDDTLTAEDIDGGTTDNCGMVSLSILSDPTNFDCSDIGSTLLVVLGADDGNGNTSSCTAEVMVTAGVSPDSDCDGVPDDCDLCDGGDDSVDNNNDGLPDCAYPPAFEDIIGEWKCTKNKVYVCHSSGHSGQSHTICVNKNALAAHIAHGDYLGPCGNVSCNDLEDQFVQNDLPVFGVYVYPNPAKSEVNIELANFTDRPVRLILQDYNGKVIWQQSHDSFAQGTQTIDLSNNRILPGVYTICVVSDEEVVTRRLVIAK